MLPNRLGSQKASTCSRIKTQCHYQSALIVRHIGKFSLIPCSFSPSPAGLGWLPLDQSHPLSGWAHPSPS
ncbi:hypothetical protein LEMLEM_LOCUS12352 [Lemmus lemmus]